MKKWFLIIAVAISAAAFTSLALAADNTEVTLSGKLVCGKCVLHQSKECQNVLQVQKDGKTVNYWLTQNKVSTDFHPNICQNDGENVTVTGKVAEKGGKETMVASKIEAAK